MSLIGIRVQHQPRYSLVQLSEFKSATWLQIEKVIFDKELGANHTLDERTHWLTKNFAMLEIKYNELESSENADDEVFRIVMEK